MLRNHAETGLRSHLRYGFVSDGELWARQRRLLSPEFRPNAAQPFLPVITESVEAILEG